MLAKPNRIVRADDYRTTVRRGRRASSPNVQVYVRRSGRESAARFGFIVAKPVGISVRRNLVRRRLKSIAADLLPSLVPGTDIVIRALPGSAQASWVTLKSEISDIVNKGMAGA